MNSTGKAVVNIVHHKYGEEASKLTQDGIAVATDVVKTTNTIKSMGMKGLAKIAAKESTKTIIGNRTSTPLITDDLKPSKNDLEDFSLPPSDLETTITIDIDSDDDLTIIK